MTGFNNDGKFVPSTPKTYTVLELKDQEVKKTPLSLAARSKVVNRSGSNYLSENQNAYGPCSRSDCNCRSGEVFTPLYTVCPATDCPESSVRRTPSYWVHRTDGISVQISNQARIQCSSSYCARDHMKNWKFKCSAHKGENDYWSTDYNAASKALGWTLITQEHNKYDQAIRDLARWIMDHPEEWN